MTKTEFLPQWSDDGKFWVDILEDAIDPAVDTLHGAQEIVDDWWLKSHLEGGEKTRILIREVGPYYVVQEVGQ